MDQRDTEGSRDVLMRMFKEFSLGKVVSCPRKVTVVMQKGGLNLVISCKFKIIHLCDIQSVKFLRMIQVSGRGHALNGRQVNIWRIFKGNYRSSYLFMSNFGCL